MASVVFLMAMSLDGFVNDSNDDVSLLYPDFVELDKTNLMKETIEKTGAVIMGRRTFEMAKDPDWYMGNYEFQVPIFVVTKTAPEKYPKEDENINFTFVDDVQTAVTKAKEVAGDKQVTVVGGPNIGRQLLGLGLIDELQVAIMPILIGKGTRLFDHLADLPIKLEKTRLVESGARTDIWFKIRG